MIKFVLCYSLKTSHKHSQTAEKNKKVNTMLFHSIGLKLGQSLSHSERREAKKCPSCSQFSLFIHPEFSRYTTYNRQQSRSNQTGVVLIFKRDSWTHLSLWYHSEFLPEVCFSVSTCGCVRKKLISCENVCKWKLTIVWENVESRCEVDFMWFHMRCFVFTCGYSHVRVKERGHFTQEHFHFYVKKRLNCEQFQLTCDLNFLSHENILVHICKYSVHMWHSDWYVKNLEKCPVQEWNYVIFKHF